VANTQYYYVVEVYNGGSTYSAELAVKAAPARPTAVTINAIGLNYLDVTLTIPAGSASNEAEILWRQQGDSEWTFRMELASSENDQMQRLPWLTPGSVVYEITGACGDKAARLWSGLLSPAAETTLTAVSSAGRRHQRYYFFHLPCSRCGWMG